MMPIQYRLPRRMLSITVMAVSCAAIMGYSTPVTVALAADAAPSMVYANDFLSYSLSERVVRLRLLAGLDSTNDSLNFNGGARGSDTIIVPTGWRVELDFENMQDLPHSAMLFKKSRKADAFPETPSEPAVRHAHTKDATVGLELHGRDHVAFIAGSAASYPLICAVPYHAREGMWIHFMVSPVRTKPEYRRNGHTQRSGMQLQRSDLAGMWQ